ncbi:hypothetical protein [Thiomonas sp.]|jgi:hypothetical protein|uniref:hypothetical protein n=1 Tax=Thiomonas sp. TaxID=2047785 RepID=UPI0026123909|nr:hypothetical protein [Thiomonas sp.]
MHLDSHMCVDRAYEDIPSEDVAGYLVRETSALAWVVDGASTLAERAFPHFPGLTDAGWFARRIDTSLREWFAESPYDPSCMAGLLASARNDYLEVGAGVEPLWAWPVAAAVIVEIDAALGRLCIYRYADCFVETAAAPSGNPAFMRGVIGCAGVRPRWKPCSGFTGSTLAVLRARREIQQRNQGTGALTLNPHSATNALLENRSIQPPSDILLGSDGLSRLWDTYGVLSRIQAMRYTAREGLASLFRTLREFEENHETGAIGLKGRDDAIGLHLRLRAGSEMDRDALTA